MAPMPSSSQRLVIVVKNHFCSVVRYHRARVSRFCVYVPFSTEQEIVQDVNPDTNSCTAETENNVLVSSCSKAKTETFPEEVESKAQTSSISDLKTEPLLDDVESKLLTPGCQTPDEILKDLVSEGRLSPPHSIAYSKKIQSLCNEGQVDEAHNLLTLMIQKNWDLKPHYFNCLIAAYAKVGRLQEALEVCSNMQGYGFRPHQTTYHTLMSSHLKQGRVFEALDMFDKMKQDGWRPNEVTSSIVAYGMCRSGHSNQIRALFQERFQKSGTVSTSVCNALLESYFRSGDIEAAEELEKRIFAGLCLPNAYTYATMIRGRCSQGKAHEAHNIFLEMEKKGCAPILGCYGSLVSLLCKKGRCRDAYDIFKCMLDKGIEAEGAFCALLLTELSKKCMIDEALQVCMYVVDKRVFVDDATYILLLEGLSKADRLDEAKPLLLNLMEKGALSNVRQFQQAMRSLERREALCRKHDLPVTGGSMKQHEDG